MQQHLPERSGEEVIEVEVEDLLFASDDGRFKVILARRASDQRPIRAIGDLGEVFVGERLRLVGAQGQHPRYGERFRVRTFTPVLPTQAAGIRRFLASRAVEGIGQSLADRLVDRFGDETLDVIISDPGRLREVEGIGAKRAKQIARSVGQRRALAERMAFLQGLGIGPSNVSKILERYGDGAPRVIRDDPYLVAEEIPGIGFLTADRIGLNLGIDPSDPRRAAGAVLHLVGKAAEDGHLYCGEAELQAGAVELDVPPSRVQEVIPMLERSGLLVIEEGRIYAPPLHAAEAGVSRHLARLARRSSECAEAKAIAPGEVALNREQMRAVQLCSSSHLMVLTGGPGTGKTTTVRAIVERLNASGEQLLLCAPTGRAAKRLNEATAREAKTIHRALEWNPAIGSFRRGPELPLEADVVLVDEASMLDIRLAHSLLEALRPDARLILVGDADQLPPVGPGPVLRELLSSEAATTIRLEEVFRQAQQSAIVRGAHAILHGRMPAPSVAQEISGRGDLFIVRAKEPAAIQERLVALLERMRERYGLDPKHDVQVLVPTRRGALGTEQLNALLQEALNPVRHEAHRGLRMRPGDKVMQLRNDYEREVYNGDLGEVRRVEAGTTVVLFDGREIRYGLKDLDDLTLAYATTIHKSQGSEFPATILVLHPCHFVLLSRPLLYTAVTRARRLAVILGDPRALRIAIRNDQGQRSRSHLAARVRALIGEAEA
ncbi:MAG: ATP-dependent RecD-like DNA helicase [Myxococcales bacterium]|nr:ATP-dependent RecD-like DNA helicase [Myxococcales bacterium]